MQTLSQEANQKGVSVQAWKSPSVDEVIEATRADVGNTSEREKEVMHVFLNIAVASVDARVGKQWKRGSTHMEFFAGTYVYEMGLACLFLDHYSDVENILYNKGLTDQNGEFLEEFKAPKQKKRRKMKTSKNSLELEDSYYTFVERIQAEMMTPGYGERMAAWDRLICDQHRCGGNAAATTTTAMTNTAPTQFLNSRDGPEKTAASAFLRRTLFDSFVEVHALGSGSSISSASTSTAADGLPPLTQPAADEHRHLGVV